MITALIALVVGLATYWFMSTRHPKNFPPGPRFPLPFVGDSYVIGNVDIGTGVLQLQKKYGDVIGMFIGSQRSVFLCDYDIIKEALSKDEVSGRKQNPIYVEMKGGCLDRMEVPGILKAQGSLWMEQRKCLMKSLNGLGFYGKSMRELVEEEARQLQASLSKTGGKPNACNRLFDVLALNSVWKLITNEKLEHDNEKLTRTLEITHKSYSHSSFLTRLAVASNTLHKVCKKLGLVDLSAGMKPTFDIIEPYIKDHMSSFTANQPRDLIDVFIQKLKEEEGNPDSAFGPLRGMTNLRANLLDLFEAAIFTTALTLQFAMMHMATYPEIQEKVQKELDHLTGRSRMINYDDRDKTPYTMAVLWEVHRRASVLPHGLTHDVTKDVQVGPYFFPKGTWIYVCLWRVMHDPKLFPDPFAFKPERHLTKNENGDTEFNGDPHVIPFAVGKRRCLGEAFAKMQSYVFFTAILSEFTVKKDGDIDLEPTRGGFSSPKPFTVRFVQRQ